MLTLWMLGLCMALLFLGGISLDLWRLFLDRRDLAGVVDSAAVAGASAIDEPLFRARGVVRLQPAQARETACLYLREHAQVGCQGVRAAPEVVEVTASRDVRLTLFRLLLPAGARGPLVVTVSARVEPRVGP